MGSNPKTPNEADSSILQLFKNADSLIDSSVLVSNEASNGDRRIFSEQATRFRNSTVQSPKQFAITDLLQSSVKDLSLIHI